MITVIPLPTSLLVGVIQRFVIMALNEMRSIQSRFRMSFLVLWFVASLLLISCATVVGSRLSEQVESPMPSGASLKCGSSDREADIDGDGVSDQIVHKFNEEAVLQVCLADGSKDSMPGLGMAEFIEVADIQGDGRSEIFFGATTAALLAVHIAVWHEGRLRAVELEDGRHLELRRGSLSFDAARNQPESLATWGCEDLDGDGVDELVSAEWRENSGSAPVVTVMGYDLTGDQAVLRHEDSYDLGGAPESFYESVDPCIAK